jgi:hypothetical protein
MNGLQRTQQQLFAEAPDDHPGGSRPFFLIVYTDVALGILKNTTDGTTVFGRSAVQDIEGV